MIFNGKEYRVKLELYRTKGSKNQKLAQYISEETKERRRKFYIVERNDKKYFIKEYTDKEYGGNLGYPTNIEYEFDTTKSLEGDITRRDGVIGAVKAIGRDKNRIMFEYLDGYRKPHISELTAIQRLVYEWLKNKDVKAYDLGINNMMVKTGKKKNGVTQYNVKMIDFEFSADRDPKKEWNV